MPESLFSKRFVLVSSFLLLLPLAAMGEEHFEPLDYGETNLAPEVSEALSALEKAYAELETYEHEMTFRSTPPSAIHFIPPVKGTGRLVWAKGNMFREELRIETTTIEPPPALPDSKASFKGKWHIVCDGKTIVICREEPSRGHTTISLNEDLETLHAIASLHPLGYVSIFALPTAYSALAYPGTAGKFLSEIEGDVESSVETDPAGNKIIRITRRPEEVGGREDIIRVEEVETVLTIDAHTGVLSKYEWRLMVEASEEEEEKDEPGARERRAISTIVCEFRNIKLNQAVPPETFAMPQIPMDSEAFDSIGEVFSESSRIAAPGLEKSRVGGLLPEMTLADAAGNTVKLSDFHPPIMVLAICDANDKEAPRTAAALDALNQVVSAQGVKVLLVLTGGTKAAKRLQADLQLSLPVYFAEEKEIEEKLPLLRREREGYLAICAVRCLVVGKDGKVVYDRAGILYMAELRAALRALGVKPDRPGKQ